MGYPKIRPDVQTINRHQRTVRLTLVSTVLQAQPSVLPLRCPLTCWSLSPMHMSSQWERQDLNKCGSTRHKKLPHPDWIEIFGPYPDPLFVPTKIVTLSYKFGKIYPFLVPRGSTPFMILMIQHSLYKDIKIWYSRTWIRPEHERNAPSRRRCTEFPLPGLVWIMMGNSSEFKTDSPC